MSAQAWVEIALKKLDCSQKELALRLGVSPSQITKWKANEYISLEMEQKFRAVTGVADHFPEFVLMAGSDENADKWTDLILYLANLADEEAETGYNTLPLQEEAPLLCWKTFHTLSEMGISIPTEFPVELLLLTNDNCDDDDFETAIKNFYATTILKIFMSLNDVFGFYAAYIDELVNHDDIDLFETGMEVEACLMSLAATKIEISHNEAPQFQKFKSTVVQDYEKWLGRIKKSALASCTPLRAEILNLIDEDHEALGFDAEAESLGVNKNRLHPDIYMNELLVGMRAIHQVLPAIIEKLGINEQELNFDPTALRRH